MFRDVGVPGGAPARPPPLPAPTALRRLRRPRPRPATTHAVPRGTTSRARRGLRRRPRQRRGARRGPRRGRGRGGRGALVPRRPRRLGARRGARRRDRARVLPCRDRRQPRLRRDRRGLRPGRRVRPPGVVRAPVARGRRRRARGLGRPRLAAVAPPRRPPPRRPVLAREPAQPRARVRHRRQRRGLPGAPERRRSASSATPTKRRRGTPRRAAASSGSRSSPATRSTCPPGGGSSTPARRARRSRSAATGGRRWTSTRAPAPGGWTSTSPNGPRRGGARRSTPRPPASARGPSASRTSPPRPAARRERTPPQDSCTSPGADGRGRGRSVPRWRPPRRPTPYRRRSSRAGSGGPSASVRGRRRAPRGARPRSGSRRATSGTCSRSRSDASVKVRGGLMDVKHLERVRRRRARAVAAGDEGRLPARRPPTSSPCSTRCASPAPPLERPAYTLDELLDEVVRPSPELLAVAVHKRRARHTIGGCMAEVTELRADGRATRTIAVESEDPERVIAAVRELGLDGRPNVCVARGLKALVGFGARRYAVIDVGTNSVKFHVGERGADGAPADDRRPRRGHPPRRGLDDTGRLGAEPIGRTVDAIAAMADEARRHGAEAIAAVGTAGLRIAPNAAELIDAVEARCGIRDRGHPRRGGGPARLPRRDGGARARSRGSRRRVRHRRRQLAVHVRPRRAGRRALQRERRRRRASPSASASTASSPRTSLAAGARRDRRGPRARWTAARGRTRSSGWAAP